MRKHLLITLLAALLLAAIYGSGPAQAQGTILKVVPDIDGTLGQNGWSVDTVTVSFPSLDPSGTIVEGCQTTVTDVDTSAEGVPITLVVTSPDGGVGGGTFYIKRDATPPVLELASPSQNLVSVDEGSTLELHALAQDANRVTVGWDLDEDGSVDAPNPTSVSIPGLQGSLTPCFIVIATDEAGNVSQIEVEVSIINLPPNIDGWVVPTMIHFGGEVQITATTSDPGDDPLTASVDWGDGVNEPVVVRPDGSLQAAHTYATDGTYQVTLTLSDDEGR